jgi:hypothetical protein
LPELAPGPDLKRARVAKASEKHRLPKLAATFESMVCGFSMDLFPIEAGLIFGEKFRKSSGQRQLLFAAKTKESPIWVIPIGI